jgi:uncharacterized protein with HEPN domain
MSRDDASRLNDILIAAETIDGYLRRGDISDGLIFDAVRMRLVEIGEAVKDLSPELTSQAPQIPWRDIAKMRDWLAHRYFDTAYAVVGATARNDLPPLVDAVKSLLAELIPDT